MSTQGCVRVGEAGKATIRKTGGGYSPQRVVPISCLLTVLVRKRIRLARVEIIGGADDVVSQVGRICIRHAGLRQVGSGVSGGKRVCARVDPGIGDLVGHAGIVVMRRGAEISARCI